MVIVLVGLSEISATIISYKLFQFIGVLSGQKRINAALTQIQARGNQTALNALKLRNPAERVLAYAITATQNRMPQGLLNAELQRRDNAEVALLNRFIRLLEVIALISPAGPAGMISSFQELEKSSRVQTRWPAPYNSPHASVLILQSGGSNVQGLVSAFETQAGAENPDYKGDWVYMFVETHTRRRLRQAGRHRSGLCR